MSLVVARPVPCFVSIHSASVTPDLSERALHFPGPDWKVIHDCHEVTIQSSVIIVPVPVRAVSLQFSISDVVSVGVPCDAKVEDLHKLVISYYSHLLEDGMDAQLAFWGDSVVEGRLSVVFCRLLLCLRSRGTVTSSEILHNAL
jgi:hypothetical protein